MWSGNVRSEKLMLLKKQAMLMTGPIWWSVSEIVLCKRVSVFNLFVNPYRCVQ